MNRLLRPALLAAALALLGGCADYVNGPWVHKIDVDQGNVVTQEMVNRLRPGMTKAQVRYALGSPLLVDVFHQERWDYIYHRKPGRGEVERRRVSLFFRDDALERLEGDYRPLPEDMSAKERIAEEAAITVPGEAVKPKEKGMLRGLWDSLFGEGEARPIETEIQSRPQEGEAG